MKRIAILGSTGSIGQSALAVVDAHPDRLQVVGLAAGEKAAYGNTLVIDHGRDITTLYGHLQRMLVNAGDKVERGQHIGSVGNTGRSTGPHLHYEVRINGVPVNPRRYVVH